MWPTVPAHRVGSGAVVMRTFVDRLANGRRAYQRVNAVGGHRSRDVVPTEQAGHACYALPQHGPESVSAIRDLDVRGRDRFHYEREQALSVSAPQALANRIDQAANVRDLTVFSVVSEQAIKNSGDGYPVDVVVPRAIFPGLVRVYDAGDLRDVDQAPYRRFVVIHRLGLDHLDRKGSIGAAAGWPIRAVV